MAEPGTTTIRLLIADHERLQRIGGIREAPLGWLAMVCLRYGMNHVDEAINEWQVAGAQREEAQKSEPIHFRSIRGGSPPL